MYHSKTFLIVITLMIGTAGSAQITTQKEASCDLLWEYSDWGRDIADHNGMFPYDYDQDGSTELIVSARFFGIDNSYSWAVIKYDSLRNTYIYDYVSDRYEEEIRKMLLQDINHDGTPELLINVENKLYVVNISSHATLATIALTGVYSPFYNTQIRYGDADNDGEDEIVVGGRSALNLINIESMSVERTISVDASGFDIGNVDNDPAIEIVLNGKAMELQGGNFMEEYVFRPPVVVTGGVLELSNIDGDQQEELIISVPALDSLVAYDVESEDQKFGRFIDAGIGAFCITDLQDDGVKEIIYGGSQWEDTYCIRASNGQQLWKISNQGHGTLGCTVADIDGDKTKELIWTTSFSDEPSIHIFNAITRAPEWKNVPERVPYFGMDVSDIDNDFNSELVIAGSLFGNLFTFDAATKKVEYESALNIIPEPERGVLNMELRDYLNDGDIDIILGTDVNDVGAIYVIDGDSHLLETSHIFSTEALTSIYNMTLTDVNNDNVNEFVAYTGSMLYIINSTTFEIMESVAVPGFQFESKNDLLVGNTDEDPASEIVVCKRSIYHFDDTTLEMKQSVSDQYLSALLFDWDNDGSPEIIATGQNGEVHVLETENLSVVHALQFGKEPITGLNPIHINQDSTPEFIASAEGRVLFFDLTGRYVHSQFFVSDLGQRDAMVVTDYDQDGIDDVFIGTERGVIQLNTSCAACLFFEADITYNDPKCGEVNGEIHLSSPDTSAVYMWDEQTFIPPLVALDADLYHITIQNQNACKIIANINLKRRDLEVDLNSINRRCHGEDDGQAYLEVTEGSSPFVISWSNGETTDTIYNLAAGTYYITVSDSIGCVFTDSVRIRQDTMWSVISLTKPACRGVEDGRALFNIQFGEPPFEFEWDGVIGTFRNDTLSPGLHTAFAIDAHGCSNTHEFEVLETYVEIEAEMLKPACNGQSTGSLISNIITGNSPYTYMWSNGKNQAQINDLDSGSYSVIVRDAKNCFAYDTVDVTTSTLQTELVQEDVLCYGDSTGSASFNNIQGIEPYIFSWSNGSTDSQIDSLGAGIYTGTITDSVKCKITKEVNIVSPPQLFITTQIQSDDELTTEHEGQIITNISGGTPPYHLLWNTGDTTPVISNLTNGFYTLQVIDRHGCQTDTTIEVPVITGMESIIDNPIMLYPNPSRDFIVLSHKDFHHNDIKLSLYTNNGLLIHNYTANVSISGITLDISSLPSGAYIVNLKMGEENVRKKFMIVR